MNGIYFDGQEALFRNDLQTPTPKKSEVLVRVKTAGVCKTDLEILKGYMGFTGVLGHEFVGVVEKGPAQLLDKRVVAEINNNCGRCEMCVMGLAKHCPNRTTMGIDKHDGAFAQFVTAPEKNIHLIPDNVSDDQAVFVEPLAAAFEPLERINVSQDDHILVIGDGRLGLLSAMVFATKNDEVTLVGKHPKKMAIANAHGINSTTLENFQPAKKWDIVIDATGCADGFSLAMQTARPQGTIILKSTFAAEGGMNLTPLVIDEITILASRCGPFDKAIDALAKNKFDLQKMITARYPLSQGINALQAASDGKNIKVLLDVD